MGSCISKKESKPSFSSPEKPAAVEARVEAKVSTFASVQVEKDKKKPEAEEVKDKGEGDKQQVVKKEIFVIKHRKSYQEDDKETTTTTTPEVSAASGSAVVRTSSCTREEVDAILIQCGRLSRSSSASGAKPAAAASSGSRKYSGSKRSYDFDNGQDNDGRLFDESSKPTNEIEGNGSSFKTKTRQSRSVSPSSGSHGGGRRRTPSRERESGSGGGTRERRVSRSPTPNGRRNRRSETPTHQQQQPGKLVSVPAAVISTSNSTNNNSGEAMPIRRVAVKRNVMSPRSQSPAKGRVTNQSGPSLSRNGSRKAEQSPSRRNPLAEIDNNAQQQHQSSIKNASQAQVGVLKPSREEDVETGNNNCRSASSKGPVANNTNKVVVANGQRVKEEEQHHHQTAQQLRTGKVEASVVVLGGGADTLKPPETLTRSRSARRSRDFDIPVEEPVPVAASSYNTILLRDIQNFHQKSSNSAPSFSLPACVAKACSILDAVADLNSTTSSNLLFSEDGNKINSNNRVHNLVIPRKGSEAKDPFVESVLAVENEITEPSLHKYVTMRRCAASLADEQESSGSNSFVGWDSSSWEPNSADSTDCWSSRSNNTREEHPSPLGFQRHTAILQRGIDK